MGFPISAQAQNPEGPVLAGLDVTIYQDGRPINFASGLGGDVDHMQAPINVLGRHKPLDHKSLGYSANFSTETFLLLGENIDGALYFPGFQSDGQNNINLAGSFDFTFADVYSGIVLRTALKCKLNTENFSAKHGELLANNLNWVSSSILPGIQTS